MDNGLDRICKTGECNNLGRLRGDKRLPYCRSCYQKREGTGKSKDVGCQETECSTRHYSRGYCKSHYYVRLRAGEFYLTTDEVLMRDQAARLKSKYKLTLEDIQELWVEKQYRGCACCFKDGPKEYTPSKEWVIDHDHNCCPGRNSCGDCIRGIVCRDCNIYALSQHMTEEVWMRVGRYLGYGKDFM